MAVRTPPTITTSLIPTLLSDFSWLDVFLQDAENINGDELVSQRFRPNWPEERAEKRQKFSFPGNLVIMLQTERSDEKKKFSGLRFPPE